MATEVTLRRLGAGDAVGGRVLSASGIILAVAFLAATVAGFMGGWWWPFALVSSFRPHFIIGLAIAAVLLALAGRSRLVWVSLAGVAVNLFLVVPLYLGAPAPVAAGSPVLRILIFNVTEDNQRMDEVLESFRTSGADLIFIFEGGPVWEDAINEAGLAYELSPGLSTAFSFANAILVRDGLEVELRGVRVGPNTPRAREVDMMLGDTPIRILAVHPPSPTSGEKARARNEQLVGVADWAESQNLPVIVVGDLNTSPWSFGYQPLAKSDLINSLYGFGLQATWPALLGPFGVPIDHLLHSDELTTVTRTTGPSLGSEHRSVSVTVAWAAG